MMGTEAPGPGVSTYEEVARVLPDHYKPLQSPMRRMEALYELKRRIESNLGEKLGLKMVQVNTVRMGDTSCLSRFIRCSTCAQRPFTTKTGLHHPTRRRPSQRNWLHLCERAARSPALQAPLIVTSQSGVNDTLDRDGSRTPVAFKAGLGLDKPIDAEVVQAVTKWKRSALKQFECAVGEVSAAAWIRFGYCARYPEPGIERGSFGGRFGRGERARFGIACGFVHQPPLSL